MFKFELDVLIKKCKIRIDFKNKNKIHFRVLNKKIERYSREKKQMGY